MGDRRLVVAFLCAVLANGATGALAQSGGPQFRVLSPLAGSLQGNSVEVRIAITSQTPVAAAGATLDNAGAPLVGSGSELRGSLDSSTLPRGSRIVAITVRDVNSRSTTARIPVVIDRKPVLTVTAPAADTVFTPSNAGIRFADSCADDGPGGCTALRVVFNGTVVAAGRSGIDVTLTKLPHSATGADNVVFIGTDSAAQTVQRTVGVQYESSARLVPVLETPGPILDASADRVLFTDAQRKHLAIRHRDTQADEQIQLPAGTLSASDARLTPHGAAFVALFTTLEPTKICEWRDGALLVLGQSSAAKLVGNVSWRGSSRTRRIRIRPRP